MLHLLEWSTFLHLWVHYVWSGVVARHEVVLQVLGVLWVVVSMYKYRHYLLFWAIVVGLLMVLVFVFEKSVYGCVECVFEKLISDGTCVEITVRNNNQLATYYQCDPSRIKASESTAVSSTEL